jgi:hypothetical protein
MRVKTNAFIHAMGKKRVAKAVGLKKAEKEKKLIRLKWMVPLSPWLGWDPLRMTKPYLLNLVDKGIL